MNGVGSKSPAFDRNHLDVPSIGKSPIRFSLFRAIVSSPPWHRHQRARRSRARAFLKRWYNSSLPPTPRVFSAVTLLESHHTRPALTKVKRRMEWNNRSWQMWQGSSKGGKGGGNGGAKGGKHGSKKGQSQPQQQQKPKEVEKSRPENKGPKDEPAFPSYESMPLSGSSSSAAPTMDAQVALAALLAANPGLTIPEALKDSMTMDQVGKISRTKEEISSEQKRLNQRRKAVAKLERLEGALARKKEQIMAYKDFVKETLRKELEKFEKERAELLQSIDEQKEIVRQIEEGEQQSVIDIEEEDGAEEISLASLLGIDDQNKQVDLLTKQRDAATAAAAVYHAKCQQLENAVATTSAAMLSPSRTPLPDDLGKTAFSPQLPQPGKRTQPAIQPFSRKSTKTEDGSPVSLVCIVSSLHDQVDRGPLLGSMARKILFGSSLDFPIDPFTCTARENRLFEVSGSLESGHARIRFGGPFSGLGVWYGLAYTVYIHPKTPTRFFTWWFEKSAEGCTSTCHSICSCGQSQFNNCRGRNEEGCTSCDERPSDISRRLRIRNHGNDYMKYVQGCTLCSHGRRRHYFPNADQLFNAFQWLWMIQWIGKGYLVWLQLLIYFGCRLCLLHFKRGSQFAGEEFCWHILRGVCWSFITFLGLWFYSRTPPRRLVKVQRRRFSIPARPCHRINHSGWIFSCLLLSSHVSAAFQALPETLTNSSVLSPSTDQNWNSDAAQVSMCSRGMPWYHLFDKGDDLQTIDVSWASTASGSSRVRGNDTSLVYDSFNERWLRVGTAHAVSELNDDTRIALHGHFFKDDARGVRYKYVNSFQPAALQTYAREFWPELCSSLPCPVHLVEEQPPFQGARPTVHFLVELAWRPPSYKYLLADVFEDSYFLRRTTVSAHEATAATDVLDAVFPWGTCQPNGFRSCVIEHQGRAVRRQDDYVPPHASYITVTCYGGIRSFTFHENLFGLHHLAQLVYSSSGDSFTVEVFRIQHDILDGARSRVCITEFQGQDLLSPTLFLRRLGCIDLDKYVGVVNVDSITSYNVDGPPMFHISWTGSVSDIDEDSQPEDDVLHLQQTGIKPLVRSPDLPDLTLRYDPEKFDQERDTALDHATFPLPQDVNDELDLPPRHRWRNLGDIRPVLELVYT
eukprot:symbB.v1.2.040693.t1/scaffold7446.1/size11214/1